MQNMCAMTKVAYAFELVTAPDLNGTIFAYNRFVETNRLTIREDSLREAFPLPPHDNFLKYIMIVSNHAVKAIFILF